MSNAKILVGAPTSKRHDYVFDRHWESVKHLPADFFYIDTTPEEDDDEYYNHLCNLVGEANVERFPFDFSQMNVHQWMSYARNKFRERLLASDYSHGFFIDTDVILPPGFDIQILLDCHKHQVGLPYKIFADAEKQPPCVFKHGYVIIGGKSTTFSFYDWDEINTMDGLTKVWATGTGCLLVEREVLEKVEFKTHPQFTMGEDIWYYYFCEEAGFESWVLPSIQPEHDNVSWDSVQPEGESIHTLKLRPVGVIPTPSDFPEALI